MSSLDDFSQEMIYLAFDGIGTMRLSIAGSSPKQSCCLCSPNALPTAAAAILVWDWLASLTLEVEYVWMASKMLTPLNATFLINRYVRMQPFSRSPVQCADLVTRAVSSSCYLYCGCRIS